MKVKTWIRRYLLSDWIEDEKAKNILLDNGVQNFTTCKTQILDIDLNEIICTRMHEKWHEAGYRYCNNLYNLVHSRTAFIFEEDDLEYEISEENYPHDIPYAYCEFDSVEGFHSWMLEEGIKEREELDQ